MMSATDELRRLLDERGVEWTKPKSALEYNETDWGRGEWTFCAIEGADGELDLTAAYADWCTPEQAIAATLGNGKLTAEQVREAIEDNSREYPSPTDPYVWLRKYDYQAIADELNATLGVGTCRNVSDPPEGFLCSECGWGDFAEPSHLLTGSCYAGLAKGPRYCPNCGRRVKGGAE